VKLGSGIKVGFITDNWRTDPLILGSGRGWLSCLKAWAAHRLYPGKGGGFLEEGVLGRKEEGDG
jgi:hypothetical protein